MKKAQLLSVVFSLIMFTGVTAGTAVAYAESDDNDHDFDDRLEHFCEMIDSEKEQLFDDHPRLAEFEERLTGYCELDEDEREELIDEFIEEHFPNYEEHDDWDMDDILDRYCGMSDEDKAAFVEKYPMASDHQDKMEEYCLLDESEREAFIEEHEDEYKKHDYDIEDFLEKYCEMTGEEKTDFVGKHNKTEDHKSTMDEYCLLDESEREAFIEEHEDEYEKSHDYRKHDYNMIEKMDEFCEMSEEDIASLIEEHPAKAEHLAEMEEYCSLDEAGRDAFIEDHKDDYKKHDYDKREMMDKFCEMSEEDRAAHLEKYQKSEDHLTEMEEFCSLDDSGRDAFIEEHKDSMKDKISDHKDDMKDKISDHKDDMKDKISDHKDDKEEKISEHKARTILRASTLTDEQKNDIREMHSDLRDMKHSLRDKSIDDVTKQDIRDQFMETAKEFSMTWLSPRHQVSAGIDAQQVECREGFELVMKTSNASPICVKETTAEKLIERGIAISAI
jgi:chromosome segregation and condensation protein ScpB